MLTTGLQDSFSTRAASYAACSPDTYGQVVRKLAPGSEQFTAGEISLSALAERQSCKAGHKSW
jgi:hypothetical protein